MLPVRETRIGKAILACVDYGDLLEYTLPCNRHHFDRIMVVTTPTDTRTIEVAKEYGAEVYTTTAFYHNYAFFNKWAAIEEALDVFGRDGWMCFMDADVLWPKITSGFWCQPGYIYTPRRRLLTELSKGVCLREEAWHKFPLHPVLDWCGYSLVVNADDPRLGDPPWHETIWTYANGADRAFADKWPFERKRVPPFEVLHLGEVGKNGCGRVGVDLDGVSITGEEKETRRRRKMYEIRNHRGKNRHKFSIAP